ncbi:ATP-binding protein [Sutcliffiella horikoshii]|uniref:ATP-binding protein n=1 Tax=Sutcliffiella horikoshii TaxID=79883 RepID=A0A1Y0CJ27_9BACI|nr:anti-sigma regulatory factor [Sutcliffiella horikoshii]ART74925.1 ATP-binding protein [Sutcliffiella horikoshii]TYS60784.1 anti-sigma regulatory factor [Sutcliffiella horikoshii]TYS67306.1 anti-sigma regulatory factor [Sutcliffiella horikoshii]
MDIKHQLTIKDDKDIIMARRLGREIATSMGFSYIDQVRITTAISELARNAIKYAGSGTVCIEVIHKYAPGLSVIVVDNGPGITSIGKALEDGYSTSDSLGAGLPGVKRMMDEFMIDSAMEKGTRIEVVKWLRG